MTNDAEIIRQVLAGDAEAYSALAEKYAAPLAAVAYSKVFDREAAGDLAQDALIEAYGSLRRLEKPETFAAWLYNIVRNKAVSHLRRKSAERRALAAKLDRDRPAGEREGLDRLAEKETRESLLAAVADLPEDFREMIAVRYYSGLSREAAAEFLGLSLDAADKRLQRALARLREKTAKLSGNA